MQCVILITHDQSTDEKHTVFPHELQPFDDDDDDDDDDD